MELNEKKKILILCTGNSCRSQIAEGFAHKAGWQAFSAGTQPEVIVNPFAVNVMSEIGIDISHHKPKSMSEYLDDNFYLVTTVCDKAKETCLVFSGRCEHQIHRRFNDPADTTGSDREITEVYRRLRDEMQIWMERLSRDYLINL